MDRHYLDLLNELCQPQNSWSLLNPDYVLELRYEG